MGLDLFFFAFPARLMPLFALKKLVEAICTSFLLQIFIQVYASFCTIKFLIRIFEEEGYLVVSTIYKLQYNTVQTC